MAVKLTEHQMMVTKSMVEFGEASANQIYRIMMNHGLNEIQGCRMHIIVDPSMQFSPMTVVIGDCEALAFGYARLTKGKYDEKYTPTGRNSPEYEWLFADEKMRKRLSAKKNAEHPLPPDGLWIGDDRNDSPVDDRWEWDINDSLS